MSRKKRKRRAQMEPRLYHRLSRRLLVRIGARVFTPEELWRRLWEEAKGEYDIETRDGFLRDLYEAIKEEKGPDAAAEFYWRMKDSGIDFFPEDAVPNNQS